MNDNKFGKVALRATELVSNGAVSNPREAWKMAAEEIITSESSKNKGCPRVAYLYLCQKGKVAGVPAGQYVAGDKAPANGVYAMRALELITERPYLMDNKTELWKMVTGGDKKHNGQLDVVLSLYVRNLLQY